MAPRESSRLIFPPAHHLVIVTEQNVLTWDASGIKKTFTSGSNGILAAKEAQNGTGTLAIADSQVVLLHQVERGMQRSYRLKGTEGQIRLLQFSPDSNTLYFSTSILNSVQSYSFSEARLLDPGPPHNTPPTALAVSPTSHLIVSASESPPVIYLQSLTNGGAPVLLNPTSSDTAVVDIAFHPTRTNIFLLTFRDGTIVAYDATRVGRANGRATSASSIRTGISDSEAEIGSIKKLHAVSSSHLRPGPGIGRSTSITGATFLPNARCRALTVGSDGKCNIVDFDRSRIVKSWHIKGPATCVSVAQYESPAVPIATAKTKLTKLDSKPNIPQTIIAIGRIDGKVLLYDTTGTLLAEKIVDAGAGRVVDVEWIPGPSVRPIGDWSGVEFKNVTNPDVGVTSQRLASDQVGDSSELETSEQTVVGRTTNKKGTNPHKTVNETIDTGEEYEADHLNEEVFSTVKHNDIAAPILLELPYPSANAYMDLFSPIKKTASPVRNEPPPIRRTPSKLRPRILSSTFVQNPESKSSPPLASARLTSPFPYEGSLEGVPSFNFVKSQQEQAPRKAPSPKRKPSGQKTNLRTARDRVGSMLNIPTSLLLSQSRDRLSPASISSGQSSVNSKILADIRQLGDKEKKTNGKKVGGGSGLLAPYYQPGIVQTSLYATSGGEGASLVKRKRASIGRVSKSKGRLSGGLTARSGSSRVRPRPRARLMEAEDLWLTAESETGHSPRSKQARKKRFKGTDKGQNRARQSSVLPENPSASTLYSQASEFADIPSSLYMASAFSESSSSTVPAALPSKSAIRHSNVRAPPISLDRDNETTSSPSHFSSRSEESVTTASVASSRNSETLIINQENEQERQLSAPEHQLPPGFAESYQGPVDVDHYLPRRGSLRFVAPGSSLPGSPMQSNTRRALGRISGNEVRNDEKQYSEDAPGLMMSSSKGSGLHGHDHDRDRNGCACCSRLLNEMESLRREVAELRRLVQRG